MSDREEITQKVIGILKQIYDPEIPIDIYELGLIYGIGFSTEKEKLVCHIEMTLTSPACPVAESLFEQVNNIALILDEIDKMDVKLVFEPPWTQERISYEGKLELGLL